MHHAEVSLFEHLLPDLRGVLLDVAGAEVRHRAGRRTPDRSMTLLRATVMRWDRSDAGGTAGA